MKGLHQQSSLLAALTKHNLVSETVANEFSASFLKQPKSFMRFLVEDNHINAIHIANVTSSLPYYWLHRIQHESMFWWRMHATHHHLTKMSAGLPPEDEHHSSKHTRRMIYSDA